MPKTKTPRGRKPRPIKQLPPLGRVLRAIRGPLSQADAAAKLGEPVDWWRRRENLGVASIADVQRIAAVFGVDWIFGPDEVRVLPRGQAVISRVV